MTMGNGATVHDPQETKNLVDNNREAKNSKIYLILLLLIPANISIK